MLWTIKICHRSSFAPCQKILWHSEPCMQQFACSPPPKPGLRTSRLYKLHTFTLDACRCPSKALRAEQKDGVRRLAAGVFDSTCRATLITDVDGVERLSANRSFAPRSQSRNVKWWRLQSAIPSDPWCSSVISYGFHDEIICLENKFTAHIHSAFPLLE